MARLPNCPSCEQPLQYLKERVRGDKPTWLSLKKNVRIKTIDNDITIRDPLYCSAEKLILPAEQLIDLEQELFDEKD